MCISFLWRDRCSYNLKINFYQVWLKSKSNSRFALSNIHINFVLIKVFYILICFFDFCSIIEAILVFHNLYGIQFFSWFCRLFLELQECCPLLGSFRLLGLKTYGKIESILDEWNINRFPWLLSLTLMRYLWGFFTHI